jgi:hypothetical protein
MLSRSEPTVKRIGLIGGLSPESTAHYYQIICREYNRRFGQLNFPELTIESLNLQTLVQFFEVDDWDSVANILLNVLERLHRADADLAAILANTPHNAYELIRDKGPLPIATIMGATAAALASDNRKQVGLLGTRPTMEYGFFQMHFQTRRSNHRPAQIGGQYGVKFITLGLSAYFVILAGLFRDSYKNREEYYRRDSRHGSLPMNSEFTVHP